MKYQETFEEMKDKAEQESVNWEANSRHQPCSHQSALAVASAYGLTESTSDEIRVNNEIRADAAFFDCLDALSHQGKSSMEHVQDNLQDPPDGDDECEVEHADEDLHGFELYLPDRMQANQTTELEPTTTLPTAHTKPATTLLIADALNNSYICVVHMNGIHHLAMVTCHCQEEHQIPLDLVASHLLPTSFTKIPTLFTMQVLDYFQLCNLELKTSAYQFYQLIWHITLLMRPAEVVNLYHELR
jgi:hypothetical protein